MILGRPINLVLGAVTALINLGVLVAGAVGYPLAPEIVAAINLAAAALISLIAGQPPTINAGDTVTVATPTGEPNRQVTVQ